jgi:DNA polymerase III alpha subunit (gram-positive type)
VLYDVKIIGEIMQSKLNLNTLLEDIEFSMFDTETTGNDTKTDKPIEVAAVNWNLKKGFLGEPKSWLVNPQKYIHPSAIAVHGLFDEDVENAPLLEMILPELHDYVSDKVLIAHNIEFDLDMLPTLRGTNEFRVDCLRFARKVYTIGEVGYKGHDLRSHKSQELRYWLNVKIDTMGLSAHRAAADILVTGEVFKETLLRFIERTGAKTLGELVDFVNAPILYEKMPIGKYKDWKTADAVREEMKINGNYFGWLLKEVHIGNMKLDADQVFSINYYIKQEGLDPNIMMQKELNKKPFKSWGNVAGKS